MKEDEPLQTVVWQGRRVTKATHWWWQNTDLPYSDLRCVHEMRLNEKCDVCKKEQSA